jgi:hypothetical protein
MIHTNALKIHRNALMTHPDVVRHEHNVLLRFSFMEMPDSRTTQLDVELDRAGFADFFFHTREQAGDWRGTGVCEVQ